MALVFLKQSKSCFLGRSIKYVAPRKIYGVNGFAYRLMVRIQERREESGWAWLYVRI